MAEVASRELRNRTRALLDRVQAGEGITITVDCRSVAVLGAIGRIIDSWIAAKAMSLGVPVITQHEDYVDGHGLAVVHF
jgi:prevent-host-death family protein